MSTRHHYKNQDAWRTEALVTLLAVAHTGRPFTAYDLTLMGVPDPAEPNRWGALFRTAAGKGHIKAVGYTQSQRPGRSSGSCRVWAGVPA